MTRLLATLTALILLAALTSPLSASGEAVATHSKNGDHTVFYGKYRMGRVACIRVLQGYRISGLTTEFCREVKAYRAVVKDDYKYVAITGWGSCKTIGSWWYVSIKGGAWELKQQVDCSYPGHEAYHVRIGRVTEVSYLVAQRYGFVREGHAPARVKRA